MTQSYDYSFKRRCFLFAIVVSLLIASIVFSPIPVVKGLEFSLQQQENTWEQITHNYSTEDTTFYDVCFINSTHGWVVGGNRTGYLDGIIIHTDDGGNSWHLQFYSPSHYFAQIEVIDEQHIWVTGFGSLFHTSDGGITWNESVVVEGLYGMSTVEFINNTHGWTATKTDLYRTTNGGHTWQNISSWTFNDVPRQIHFVTLLDVWAIGFQGIYHSTDGGFTWVQNYNRGGWTISFVSDNNAWAVADNMLAHMTDGTNWVEQTLPRPSQSSGLRYPYFTDVLFMDELHGWISGGETSIVYTPDSGSRWYEQSTPLGPQHRVMAIDFVNLTHGYAVGTNGAIIQTFQGNNLDSLLLDNDVQVELPFLISIGVVGLIVVITVILVWKRKRDSTSSGYIQKEHDIGLT
ncbi:MAG: YCF48-related protein [Candidatus Thorarchaeota archaeon]